MTEINAEPQIREPLYLELCVALREEWQQIPRTVVHHIISSICLTGVMHMCCTGRSHPILIWTSYILCVSGKIKKVIISIEKQYKGSLILGSGYILRRINSQISLSDVQEHTTAYGPHCENSCLWCFQPSKTQVKLLSYRG